MKFLHRTLRGIIRILKMSFFKAFSVCTLLKRNKMQATQVYSRSHWLSERPESSEGPASGHLTELFFFIRPSCFVQSTEGFPPFIAAVTSRRLPCRHALLANQLSARPSPLV